MKGGGRGMAINYQAASDDVFEEACLFVVASDVVSRVEKRAMLYRLAAMKLSINCPRGRCRVCGSEQVCRSFVDQILAM
jgi:hypothetical protein